MMRRIRFIGAASMLFVAACGQSIAPSALDKAAPLSDTEKQDMEDCVWLVRSDPVLVNALYPDKDAVYYIATVPSIPGAEVTIRGTFPRSRYMSFVTYDGLPIDALLDRDIRADVDHTNPYVPGADRTATQRSYSVNVIPSPPPTDASERQPGALYSGAGQSGVPSPAVYLFYRIYVTDEGQSTTGGEPLPVIEVAGVPSAGGFVPLSCENLRDLLPSTGSLHESYVHLGGTPALPAATRNAEPIPVWSVESGLLAGRAGGTPAEGAVSGGPGSNPHNLYLSANVSRAHGDLLVVRARAPTTPPTRAGEPVMSDGDLRYWSICQNSLSTRYLDCVSDSDIVVNDDGTFTLVVSTPEARPSSAKNWLPFGPEPEGRLLYRHMLPSTSFRPQSAQGYDPAKGTLEQQMGAYYPHTVYCKSADFDANACK